MNVVIVGAGLMGAQIGVEYALGGHAVVCVARRPAGVGERVQRAFDLVVQHRLAPAYVAEEARKRLEISDDLAAVSGATDLVVESVVEDLATKIEVLRRCAELFPGAILASNTSSLSITAMGEGAGASERTIGTHYWNPPLLMPLVEVIKGAATDDATVDREMETLRALGKRPVLVEQDVPGFVWNRLQLALLREAAWIVEQGVASPATVDEIVRDGLARRWRLTGPFETVALGGPDTFARVAALLFPVLSDATSLDDLGPWLERDPAILAAIRERRDAGLVEELRREKASLAQSWARGGGGERADA
jgi:3-hydroxybutyryl-CoA dehydrogenase